MRWDGMSEMNASRASFTRVAKQLTTQQAVEINPLMHKVAKMVT